MVERNLTGETNEKQTQAPFDNSVFLFINFTFVNTNELIINSFITEKDKQTAWPFPQKQSEYIYNLKEKKIVKMSSSLLNTSELETGQLLHRNEISTQPVLIQKYLISQLRS